MKDFWNERFKRTSYVYGIEPNSYFKEELNKLTAGKLILPAEGEGRNAVYAAQKGWDVVAVDFSLEGRRKALQLAKQEKVEISYHESDVSTFDYGENIYDAAAFIYVHLPRSIIREVYEKVIRSLKTDAAIIIEVYSVNQLGRDSGGPTDERVLYTEEKLRSLITGCKIDYLAEKEVTLNEGDFHIGKAMVLRALATKK